MSELLAIVVEDDAFLSSIFAEAIKMAGYVTETYADGSSALRRFHEAAPHLVVLDMHLPDVMGSDLLPILHTLPNMKDSQIIIATADPLLADIYQDQADFVLIKPISFSQLRDLARRLGGTPNPAP